MTTEGLRNKLPINARVRQVMIFPTKYISETPQARSNCTLDKALVC